MPAPQNTSRKFTKKPHGFIIHADSLDQAKIRCEFFITPPPLRVLSFKGGAARTVVYRVVLKYLAENHILEQIEEIGGGSSGCLAAIFGCIPYENSADRIRAMDNIIDTNPWEVMGSSSGWQAYKILTAPLNLISEPAKWISSGIDKLIKEYNDSFLERMVGFPFKLISLLFKSLELVTSPRSYAAIYNLITAGGIYHGDITQNAFRVQIQLGVQNALDALLERHPNKKYYIDHLQKIGLCHYVDGKLIVVPDITFNHLYELTKIPGSQFKQCYLPGARIRDKQLIVFNKDNTPDMPIHLGCRIDGSFPVIFTDKKYLGDRYFDGGTINNAPVDLATDKKLSKLYEAHGVTDKLARLNIRVEFSDDYKHHLWLKQPEKTYFDKLKDHALQSFLLFFTRGIDAYANDEIITHTMQTDYPQRTLQLKDLGISYIGSDLTQKRRDELYDQLMPEIEEYFNNHLNEKIITNYELSLDPEVSSTMPIEVQAELYKFLLDKENATDDIFDIPVEGAELENFRTKLIKSLSDSKPNNSPTSTSIIHRNIGDFHGTSLDDVKSSKEKRPQDHKSVTWKEPDNHSSLDNKIYAPPRFNF